MKLILGAAVVWAISFGLCSLAVVSVAHRALKTDLETKITQDSEWLAAAGRDLILNKTPRNKDRLTRLCQKLLKEPGIAAVMILDQRRHVVAQASKPINRLSSLFSLKIPIRVDRSIAGWVRASYAPGYALEEFWSMAGDLAIVLFCGMLLFYGAVFFALNEWLFGRPFKQ